MGAPTKRWAANPAPGEPGEDLGRRLEHALLARYHGAGEPLEDRVPGPPGREDLGRHVGQQVERGSGVMEPGHQLGARLVEGAAGVEGGVPRRGTDLGQEPVEVGWIREQVPVDQPGVPLQQHTADVEHDGAHHQPRARQAAQARVRPEWRSRAAGVQAERPVVRDARPTGRSAWTPAARLRHSGRTLAWAAWRARG